MRIFDLCSGAGGAAMGLHQAFPDAEIIGVDIRPQPRYPFAFVRGDILEPFGALDYLIAHADRYDFVWASPPCQRYMTGGLVRQRLEMPDLIGPVREKLRAWGGPWIMENVPGAPLDAGLLLCGSMFGLGIRRHRLFEANFPLGMSPGLCQHHHPITGIYGHPHGLKGARRGIKHMLPSNRETWSTEMGVDWMDTAELSQAIPPAYSRYLAQFIPVPDAKVADDVVP